MKILAIEKEIPGVMPDQFTPALKRIEAHQMWQLYQAEVVREMYFRIDRNEAVLLLECADLPAAQKVLQSLPLVQSKLITFELIPLKPYPGFARLFTNRPKKEMT